MTFVAINRALATLECQQKQILTRNVYLGLQDVLEALKSAIEEIHVTLRIDKFKTYQSKIKLCASQLTKAIPLLVDVTKGGQNVAYKAVTDFLIEKIRWCLLEVLRIFNGGGAEDDGEPGGMFVKLMDTVITSLETDGTVNESFRNTVDELLCQALTIANLSAQAERESIKSGCKHVLTALSDFAGCKRNSSHSFKIDALQSALEVLERRVNMAVLRLFLHLGSDPNLTLKNITLRALEKRYVPRNVEDLTFDLNRLDLDCEQIQLIGNFAVACSDDPILKVKILSCLASIEFCENFFHSAAEQFYMEPNDLKKKGFFKFLADEYDREMKELTHLIDCVVDTETFIQMVLSDLAPLTVDINSNFNKRNADAFLSRSVRLLKHLNSMTDESVMAIPGLSSKKKEFETALAIYQASLRMKPCNLRAIREVVIRLETVLHVIRKISYLFTASSNGLEVTNTPKNKMRLRKTTFVSSRSYKTSPNTAALERYLVRVEGTPRMKSALYVVTPRKKRPLYPVNKSSVTNISDVLENIRDFPDTFTSNATIKTAEEEEEEDAKDAPELDTSSQLATSITGLDTVGRIEDIQLLDDKINKLKMV